MGSTSRSGRNAGRQCCAYATVDPFSGSKNFVRTPISNIDGANLGMAGAMNVRYLPAPWRSLVPLLDDVKSPCTGECRLHRTKRWCVGCGRTASEIGRWPNIGVDEKRKILSKLANRIQIG